MGDESKSHLVHVSRLSQAERSQTYATASVWSDENLRLRLQQTIEDVCLDRLIRADGCLQVARQLAGLAPGPDLEQEILRASIGRAYYSVHHSIRVICLRRNGWDPDSHAKSVDQLKELVADADFQQASGLTTGIIREIAEARANREVADHSPYSFSRNAGDIKLIPITAGDWTAATLFNISLAEQMLGAATKIILQ